MSERKPQLFGVRRSQIPQLLGISAPEQDKMAADFDEDDWNRAVEDLDEDHQRIDEAPTTNQRLGRFTVVALILNRTIGILNSTSTSKSPHTNATQGREYLFLPSKSSMEPVASGRRCYYGSLVVSSELVDCLSGWSWDFRSPSALFR
jgi:hypothetical protein